MYRYTHDTLRSYFFSKIVSHHALAGSLRLDSKAALMPQIGLCAKKMTLHSRACHLPLNAQIIACSLHPGGEGASQKQIRESACQFHRIDSASV